MSATKQRGTMPEAAERLARRERRILKRVAAYEALMEAEDSRREHLVELLWDAVDDLERLVPQREPAEGLGTGLGSGPGDAVSVQARARRDGAAQGGVVKLTLIREGRDG